MFFSIKALLKDSILAENKVCPILRLPVYSWKWDFPLKTETYKYWLQCLHNICVDLSEAYTRFSCVLPLKHVNVIQVNSITYLVKSVPWKMRLHLFPKTSVLTFKLFHFMTKNVKRFFDCSWWGFGNRFSHCIYKVQCLVEQSCHFDICKSSMQIVNFLELW